MHILMIDEKKNISGLCNMVEELINEDVSSNKECNLCNESEIKVGDKTKYGAKIVFRIGNKKDGWFATLSPKTGGNPKKDLTLQLMPLAHLTHFCQVDAHPELAKNYGIAFAKLSQAITKIMANENPEFKTTADSREKSTSIAVYGKCTNWKEKKEHLHIKIFPFRGNIGQPYTVDSSFGRKEVCKEPDGKEFVKMLPVRKVMIDEKRFEKLSNDLIDSLS